jgi:hypothetical protein
MFSSIGSGSNPLSGFPILLLIFIGSVGLTGLLFWLAFLKKPKW